MIFCSDCIFLSACYLSLTVIPYRSLESKIYKQPFSVLPQVTSKLFGEGSIISHPEYPGSLGRRQHNYSLTLHNPCDSKIKLENFEIIWEQSQLPNGTQLAIAVNENFPKTFYISPKTPLPNRYNAVFTSSITFSLLANTTTISGFRLLYHCKYLLKYKSFKVQQLHVA